MDDRKTEREGLCDRWRGQEVALGGREDHGKPDQVEVSSKDVEAPVAVRYAWADNPVCNVYSESLCRVTPFRTDDWEGVTARKR